MNVMHILFFEHTAQLKTCDFRISAERMTSSLIF